MSELARPRVFISLPMRGISDSKIQSNIKELYSIVENQYDLIDTFIDTTPSRINEKENKLWFLGRSIQMLGTADLVLFSKDWQSAPGCIIERMVCTFYGIPCVDEAFARIHYGHFPKFD